MAALVLSIAVAVVIGTGLWLVIGPKITFGEDPVQNQVLNVVCYIGIAFLISLPFVFLLIGDWIS